MKPTAIALPLILISISFLAICCREVPIVNEAEGIAQQWMELYSDGTPTFYGSDRFLELYADDCTWSESLSRMFPEGRKGGLEQIRKELAGAQSVLVDRHVVLHEVVANGSFAAMRYSWSAIANEEVEGYTKGSRIAFEAAAFFKVHQGRIIEIRELLVELT